MQLDYIAHGRTADIAPYAEGRVVKLFKEGFPPSGAEEEYRVSGYLHRLGVTVPKVYEMIELNGRTGIVYERVEGITMLHAIGANPLRCLTEAVRMADIHASIYNRAIGQEFPLQKKLLRSRISESQLLTEEDKRKVAAVLDRLPAGEQLCHGDFHPDNVMIGERVWVLDWMTGMSGHPAGDVMRTAILLRYGTMPEGTSRAVKLLFAVIRRAILARYLLRYRRATGIRMQDIEAWFLPIAAARLAEWIPEEEKTVILREIRRRMKSM